MELDRVPRPSDEVIETQLGRQAVNTKMEASRRPRIRLGPLVGKVAD